MSGGDEEDIYVSWEEAEKLTRGLAEKIQADGFKPDIIICINRGGMVPARVLADYLDVKHVYSTGSEYYTNKNQRLRKPRITQRLKDVGRLIRGSNVLVTDEVCQTGHTMEMILAHVDRFSPLEVRTAVLHVKPERSFHPDYYNGEVEQWVVYPWETEERKRQKENDAAVNNR
jgi:hypoxanthine phosphoribosyltransferase